VLDDLCNKYWQNTYLRHFLLTWVQNGPFGFEKKSAVHKKKYEGASNENHKYFLSRNLLNT